MPREKDPFWKYVTFLNENNSKWRCNFCGQENGGGATRIKAHLAGIGGFGIKGCERVDVNVRAEAREVLMPKKVMDLNHRGVSEERIQGNVRAAPTSTSHPPNVEGGTNLQFPQGLPPLTPQTRALMDEMVPAVNEVDIANLPLDGATSYSSASPLPNSFFSNLPNEPSTFLIGSLDVETLNAQQNPCVPLPSQKRQLLDKTFQNELQGSNFPGPIASDTQLTNMATTDTPLQSNQPHQSFHRQCGHGTGLSPPRASMNIEPPIPSQPFNERHILEPFNSPSQIPEDIIKTIGPSTSEGGTISCSMMALAEVESYLPNSPNQPQCSIRSLYPEETLMNDQQTPAGASSFQHDELPAVGNSNCLQDCNQHSQLQTPMDIDQSIGSQHTSDSHIIEATIVDLRVLEVATNATGPSSSQDMNRGSPIMNVRSIYANDEEIRNLKRKVEELGDKEAVIKEQMETEFAASSVRKKPRILVEIWLNKTERARDNFQIIGQANAETLPPKEQVETLTREVGELIEQTLPQTLFLEERDAKGVKFLERKLIGDEIHRNIELIWDRLKENHVCKLGIYGMGGVGKTTIMMNIHNRLLKDATIDGVLFITVSQDFSIYKLQSDIWKALDFGVMEDEHDKKRAAILSERLERKKNCVLFLDDVWWHFKLQDVGIPDRAGLKVVLTTRFSEVCSRMDCEEIKIQPLGKEEAWKLFVEDLGPKLLTNTQVEKVARKIVNRCAGLPLAINTMASSLRGEKNYFVWQDTLNKLDKSHTKHTEMGDKVLPVLKLSYERLSDPQVKQCFLFCAIFPEDESIDQMELIEYFIDEGFLDGLDTRDAQYYRGLAIVDMLRKACLLEVDYYDDVRMHDLVREMALHIRGTTYMVNAGPGLRRIPNGEYWMEDLEKVSLMQGYIKDIPPYMSPNCPKLSTLLLNGSLQLENVQLKDSFFMKLQGLKVLNVSGCAMRVLPDSLSELVNLRALLLRDCRSLLFIPHLRKLKFLRKLDANGCRSLVEVQGLEELRNLRYLDLYETGIERLLEGTLKRIVNLQYLWIAGTVEAEEVIQLNALESLDCKFGNVDDFNKYVRFIERSGPHHNNLIVDKKKSLWSVTTHVYPDPQEPLWIQESHYKSYRRSVEMRSCNCAVARVGKESNNDSILIPGDVEFFMGINCHGMTNLSGVGLLRCLEVLLIIKWDDLVVLFGGDGVDEEEVCNTRDSPASLFPSLETLQIEGCSKLKYLFGHESGFSLPLGGPAFPNLREITVINCNIIRELLPHESLLHLPNLEHITVRGCEGIEGIIGRRGENHEGSPPLNTPSSSLPSPFSPYFRNLRTIRVENCNSIRELLPHECFLHLPNPERVKVSDCERIDEIISGGGENRRGSAPLSTPSSSLLSPFSPHFPNLRTIAVGNCNNITELLSHECLPHFPNLECIEVICCGGIEEIISEGGENRGENHEEGAPLNTHSSSLPSPFSALKLKRLVLIQLPQLKNIMWEGALSFFPDAVISVHDCPKLKTIPPCVERLNI